MAKADVKTPPTSPGSAADLTFKFQSRHYVNFRDHITDGFFDAGRSAGVGSTIEQIEANLRKTGTSREVLLIDSKNDPGLAVCVEGAKELLRPHPDLQVRCQLLALYVANGLGGTLSTRSQNPKELHERADAAMLARFKAQNDSRIVRLGQLWGSYGLGRHRALLFKYLCDQSCLNPAGWTEDAKQVPIGLDEKSKKAAAAAVPAANDTPTPPPIECRLMRGAHNEDTNPRAWNTISIPVRNSANRIMILDLMKPDGSWKLIPENSAEGRKYARLKPDGTGFDPTPLPAVEPLFIDFSELTNPKALPSEDQGAQSIVFFANLRGQQVIVKQRKPSPVSPSHDVKTSPNAAIVVDAAELQRQKQAADKAAADEAFAKFQFEMELKTLSNFRHRNVVSLIAAVEEPFSIILERVTGGDLYHIIGKMTTWPLKLDLIVQIAQGLEAMHTYQPAIVHRDLKPGNILWSPEEKAPKICDFGLARFTQDQQVVTRHSTFGTRVFMAQEQMHDDVLTAACDVYAFGGIIFWIASNGVHPWWHIPGGPGADAAVMRAVMKGEPPKLPPDVLPSGKDTFGKHPTQIPYDLYELMCECFKFKPTQRPVMREVLRRLLAIRDYIAAANSGAK